MDRIFNLDNGFFRLMSKLVDCIYVTILWLIGCIPIVTAGAATTAFYYTVHKVIRQDRGYVFQEFKNCFVKNLKQSTIIWIVFLLVGAFLGTDAYLTYQLRENGDAIGNVFYLIVFLLFIMVIMWIYLFPYISRFEDDLKTVVKNSLFIGLSNPLRTAGMLITGLVAGYMVYVLPILILIAPTLYMLGIEQLMERIYQRFTPEDANAENHKEEQKPIDGKKIPLWNKFRKGMK